MWNAVKDMLASKKALVAALSVLVYFLGKFGLDMSVEALLPAVAPLWAYVLGQGLADNGKEAEKVAVARVLEDGDA